MTLPDWTCVLSRFSCVCLFVTPWTSSCQAPQSMGFSRQEYWSGLPFPPPGNLPDPGIEPTSLMSPVWQSGSLPLAPPGSPWQGWKWESSFLIHLCCAQLLSPIHLSVTSCSPPGSCVRGDSPGKNTGIGCCLLLQEIFPTQGSNTSLPHCRQILYRLSHQGSKPSNNLLVRNLSMTLSTLRSRSI